MTNSKKTRKALLSSVLALLLCVTMLLGTTFAWFTDTASTSVNKIQAGTLDVALEMKEGNNWVSAEGKTLDFVKAEGHGNEAILWEPGCTYKLPELRVVNKGNLALKYKVVITGIKGDAKLNEVIDWTIGDVAQGTEQKLAADAATDGFFITGTMNTKAGNAYQGLSIDGISITVYATQDAVECDSNGNTYDKSAEYSSADVNKTALLITGGTHTINKNLTIDGGSDTVDAIRVTGGDVTITGGSYSATGTGSNSALRVDGGNVTIKGGEFSVGGNNNCIYGAGGNITIEGGTFKSEEMYDNHYWTLNVKDYSGSVITLKGGKFYQFNPTDPANNTAPTGITEIVLADGYKVVQNGDWYYVVHEDAAVVANETALEDALTKGGSVTLTQDMILTTADETITNSGNTRYYDVIDKDTDIDLNGHTLTLDQTKALILRVKDATVTISNGTIVGYGNKVVNVVDDANVTLTNCTIKNNKLHGVDVTRSESNNGKHPVLTLNNCTIEAQEFSVGVFDGGKAVINGGTYTSYDNCVIGTNGSTNYAGAEITINGGTFNGSIRTSGYIACGIYMAHTDDKITVNGGTFNIVDGVGLLARNGAATVSDSVVWNITATGSTQKEGKVGDSKTPITAGTEFAFENGTINGKSSN